MPERLAMAPGDASGCLRTLVVRRRDALGKGHDHAIAGVMAVFVGLLATVVLSLGREVLPVPAALVLAASAFVAVRAFKLNLIAVFGAGIAAWASLSHSELPDE